MNEDSFWSKFWEDSEKIVRCIDCPYQAECREIENDNVSCGTMLSTFYHRRIVGESYVR